MSFLFVDVVYVLGAVGEQVGGAVLQESGSAGPVGSGRRPG
ncbi:hypothetical protein [Streptomyces caniscabiei]|nr:hypothetical protein [Streptomyces caniscabiei]MDX3727475.1 hypothetical protein [Streptomyces caniscabiei]WEO21796.1 hypothetical protein IHE65_00815 [Streptomyces caniscabiei]